MRETREVGGERDSRESPGVQMLDRRHMDAEPDQRTVLVVYTDLQEPCN